MSRRWEEFQETGFQAMDVAHQELSELLAGLLDAVNANDKKLATAQLGRLVTQYAAHFAHEERLMAESQYPLAERHRQAHTVVMADATRFLAELTKHGLSASFRRWVTGRALEGFRLHVAANDVGLGRFMASRVPGKST